MPKLELKLQKDLEGAITSAVVEVVSGQGDVRYSGRIPVGYNAEPIAIDLDPSAYLVRATLPSGETVTRSIALGRENVTMIMEASHSRHEWLSWHEFTSGLGRSDEPISATVLPALADNLARTLDLPTLSFVGQYGLTENMPVLPPWPNETWKPQIVRAAGLQLEVFRETDEDYFLVRLRANEPPQGWPAVYIGASAPGGEYRSARLPVPWPARSDNFEQHFVEVLIARSRPGLPDPRGGIASLLVRDPVVGPLISFLAAGDPASARTVSADLYDAAQELLWFKLANPYAAAAGGYVLLRTMRGAALPDWHAWPRNLAVWFPWLPDGAVIYCWQQLLRPDGDIAIARQYFIEAALRGVPVFTEGVRLLSKAATLFGHHPSFANDSALTAAVRLARAYSVRIDPHLPFATWSLPRPKDEGRSHAEPFLPLFPDVLGVPPGVLAPQQSYATGASGSA